MHLTQRKHGGEVVSPLIPANPSDLPHFRAAMQAIPDMALGLNVGKKGKLIKYFMQ